MKVKSILAVGAMTTVAALAAQATPHEWTI